MTEDYAWTGVAVGAGWQSIVAYVNIACYYLIGIPIGLVLGYFTHMEVKVSYFLNSVDFYLYLDLAAVLLLI